MRKLIQNEFIEKAIKVHGNTYLYSLTSYINKRVKVNIICRKHGIFKQLPYSHLNGNGCTKCYYERRPLEKILKHKNLFLDNAKQIHCEKYDYSLVQYLKSKIKVKIMCLIHGVFEQTPSTHLLGQGCPNCGEIKRHENRKIGLIKFIERSRLKHGNKYDYSEIKYFNRIDDKVKIICPIHGAFEQIARFHANGVDCPKCGLLKIILKKTYNTNDFIEIAKLKHGEKYAYSEAIYINNKTHLNIICKKHGIFSQRPSIHLQVRGCPICKESKGEKVIRELLDLKKISYIREKVFDECKHIKKLKFDFYVPSINQLIEYDGK
jgi:ssDNA-binding Zn-finger/Zn-ribbon topoisomerase 1